MILHQTQETPHVSSLFNYRIDDMTQKKFLKVDGTNSMTGDLNLNNNTIVNLHTDGKDLKSAVNADSM